MTVARGPARQGAVALVAAALAAIVVFDALAVSVLLPSMRVDLGASSSGAQWVVNAYLLALAALLPVLARMAGVVPVRALAAAGGVALALGAGLCALGDSTAPVVAGRAVEGAGAAALLASVAGVAPAARRPAAAGTALLAVAFVAGPVAGGAFAQLNWFRIFFWAGVPLAAVATAAAMAVARPLPARPDLPRLLALGAGLTAATVALVQSEPWGWGWTALLLVAGLGLLWLAPWRAVDAVGAAWAAVAACAAALAFLLPQYLELARILSGLRVGVLLLALTLPAALAWAVSRRLSVHLPARGLALAGLACAAAALALLGTLDADTSYAVLVAIMLATGTGLGTVAGAAEEPSGSTIAATAAGAALGLAAAGAAFQHAQADERAAGSSFEQALATGVGWAALLLALLLVATAVALSRLRGAE